LKKGLRTKEMNRNENAGSRNIAHKTVGDIYTIPSLGYLL